jgi:hypothetical protein
LRSSAVPAQTCARCNSSSSSSSSSTHG